MKSSLSSLGANFLDPLSSQNDEAISDPAPEIDGDAACLSAPPDPLARRVYSLSEVARIFGLTARTLRWWAATGRIRTIQIGQKRFVADTELHRVLTSGALPEATQDHE